MTVSLLPFHSPYDASQRGSLQRQSESWTQGRSQRIEELHLASQIATANFRYATGSCSIEGAEAVHS